MSEQKQARSVIWCARTPHFSPLAVGEVVQVIEAVNRTEHLFVFIDTVDSHPDGPGPTQVALHLEHISGVSVAREA